MTEKIIKKRYPALAALFSLVSPGLGHLYVGKCQQAVLVPIALLAVAVLFGWTGLIFLSQGMYLLMACIVIFYLVVIVSSITYARNTNTHNLNRSQRWYFYIVFIVVVSVVNSMLVDYRGKLFAYETFHIPASSMLPGLSTGDLIVVDTYAYSNKQAEIGDVVVFDYPKDRSVKYIKRVIGKGGDHIVYNDKQLYINGIKIEREYVGPYHDVDTNENMEIYDEIMAGNKYTVAYMKQRPALNAEYIVPDGYYFVMGDNRDNSNDSRFWGVVPESYLKGKAMYIWFSFDGADIHSERIGLRL